MVRFGCFVALGMAWCRSTLSLSASIDDESCLVQRERGVQLAPASAMPIAGDTIQVGRVAKQFLRQLPLSLASASALGLANASSTDPAATEILGYVVDLIMLFKNDTVVDALYAAVRNMTTGLGNHSVKLGIDARMLWQSTKNASQVSVDEVFEQLESFLYGQESALAKVFANAVLAGRDVMQALPPGKLRDAVRPALKGMEDLTAEQVYETIFNSTIWPTTEALLANRSGFCANFKESFFNLSAFDTAISEHGQDFLNNSERVLSQIDGFLVGLGLTGVAPQIRDFGNITATIFDDVIDSYNISTHILKEALWEIGTYRLGCNWTRPTEDKSFAAARSGAGLQVLVALAAAAWAWLSAE